MNEESLRRLIREEVEQALDEADKAKKGPPKTFAEFRKQVGAALKKAKAPPALVDEVNDTGYEGGGVVSALWNAWSNIESELKDAGPDAAKEWPDLVGYYVHDAVIDMVGEFSNPMNYGPGEKKGQKRVDPGSLAAAVVDVMAKKPKPTAEEKKSRELRDMAGLVEDILDGSHAVAGPQWDGKNRVTYRIISSDYLERIFDIATEKAGLKPLGPEDEAPQSYVDDITGLKVTFGDGFAVIE